MSKIYGITEQRAIDLNELTMDAYEDSTNKDEVFSKCMEFCKTSNEVFLCGTVLSTIDLFRRHDLVLAYQRTI